MHSLCGINRENELTATIFKALLAALVVGAKNDILPASFDPHVSPMLFQMIEFEDIIIFIRFIK